MLYMNLTEILKKEYPLFCEPLFIWIPVSSFC